MKRVATLFLANSVALLINCGDDEVACSPQSSAVLCEGRTCGTHQVQDNCDNLRSIDCSAHCSDTTHAPDAMFDSDDSMESIESETSASSCLFGISAIGSCQL